MSAPKTDAEFDERFSASCDAIGSAIDRLQRENALLLNALEDIAQGRINTDFVMSDPPNWHRALSDLQAIAKSALAKARGEQVPA